MIRRLCRPEILKAIDNLLEKRWNYYINDFLDGVYFTSGNRLRIFISDAGYGNITFEDKTIRLNFWERQLLHPRRKEILEDAKNKFFKDLKLYYE